jgi:hypothetical protein
MQGSGAWNAGTTSQSAIATSAALPSAATIWSA